MSPIKYFAIGGSISLLVIIAVYSPTSAVASVVLIYYLYRMGDRCIRSVTSNSEASERSLGSSTMETLNETEEELTIRGSERILVLNRRTGTISGLHSKISSFEKVKNVKISVTDDGDGATEYSVWLSTGAFSSLCVGYTRNEIDASLMAAKFGMWLGKDVVC